MFYKVINLIKINYSLKKKYVKIQLNKKDLELIKIFLRLNIISVVKEDTKTKNYFTIFFKYLKEEPVFTNIKNLYKPSRPVYIGLNELIKINKKKNNIFILSTNKGLITNFNAEQKKIGGILVMSIQI